MTVALSFKNTILLGCLAVVLTTLTFTGILLHYQLKPRMLAQYESALGQQAIILREVLSDRWAPELPPETVDFLADEMGRKLNMRLTLIGPDGAVLGDSEVPFNSLAALDNHGARPEVLKALDQGQGVSIRHSATLGVDLLYLATTLNTPQNPKLIIRLALPLREVRQTLMGVRKRILVISLLGVLLSLAAAYVVALRISRPVRELTRTTRLITAGKHSTRVRRYPANEIGILGRAFDRMADHLEEEIRQATNGRNRIEGILKAMVEGVLVLDAEGRIVLANRSVEEFFGLSGDSRGHRFSEIIRHAKVVEIVSRVLEGEAHATEEIWTVGPERRALDIHAVRLADGPGNGGSVVVFNDVTELKKIDEIRRDFVANLSHDIRTPLAAIRGAVETVLSGAGKDPQQAERFLKMIERQVNRIQVLSEDLLSLARLERGLEGANFKQVEVASLLEAGLSASRSMAEDKGVALESETPAQGVHIFADRARLEEALANLIDNAVKYTEPGGRVRVATEFDNREVRFVVLDTGPGISAEHVDRIFERFYRVDKARSRENGGTGLGLAIVKHAVQLHGGRVEVDSTPGKGSVFTLIIPAQGPASVRGEA